MKAPRRLRWTGARACLVLVLGIALPIASMAHGDLETRISELEALIVSDPGEVSLLVQLARVNAERGSWEIALFELARVDQMAPGKYPTDLLRGEIRLGAGQPAAARLALDRFLAAYAGHSRALMVRARAWHALGCEAESLNDYRAALQTKAPAEPDLFEEIAAALALQNQADEALVVLEAGIARLGAIPSLSLRALDLEAGSGRFEAALERVARMQKEAPRPEPWMARRAAILAKAGRIEESRKAWKALLGHVAGLPPLERGSRAMTGFCEQAQLALSGAQLSSRQ